MKTKAIVALSVLLAQSACAAPSIWDSPTPALARPTAITVYRSPTCSCCEKWIVHVRRHGFTVNEVLSDDMEAVKQELKVPKALQSCHTAKVGSYVIEGHVPAGDVKRLLATQPKALGLAAPGMPLNSPGMEMGGQPPAFSVYLFDGRGESTLFHDYANDKSIR